MTIDEYMKNLQDPELIVSIGSATSYFFIGTKDEYEKLIDKLSRKELKRLKMRRNTAEMKVTIYKARLAEEPIKLMFGKDLEQTLDYLNYALRENEKRLKHYTQLLEVFMPYRKRKVKDTYKRIAKADGIVVIVEGEENGDFWTRDEFEEAMRLEKISKKG